MDDEVSKDSFLTGSQVGGDSLVKNCARCGVTRSKKFFVTRRGDYSEFCAPCRGTEKKRAEYHAQKKAYKKFTGMRYGLPYPRLLARLDEKQEKLEQAVVERLNAFAVRAVADALKRVASTRYGDRKTTGQGVYHYKERLLEPLLIGVREQIKGATLEGRRILYPTWLITPEQMEGLNFGFALLSGTPRVKRLASLDKYEPDPRLLALNNAMDLPNREKGLSPQNRAYLYEFLFEWCDKQRLEHGLAPMYRKKLLPDDGVSAFVEGVNYGRKADDPELKAAKKAWRKIPDVVLDEPGKPVEYVADVEKRINELVKAGVLEKMAKPPRKAWWKNERVISGAFEGFDPTGFVDDAVRGGLNVDTLGSPLFKEAGGSRVFQPGKKDARALKRMERVKHEQMEGRGVIDGEFVIDAGGVRSMFTDGVGVFSADDGENFGLASTYADANLTQQGRPTIEQTLCRAYIDMRINEETMWSMFPEHFKGRDGPSV